jgi:quercetin dioxygenase-like cupin family protein
MKTQDRGVVKRAAREARQPITAGKGTEVQVLVGPGDGAPHFALRRFIMQAGGSMPMHVNTVEHEQYVLRGKARLTIGGETHEVGPDTALFIPAGIPHDYQVIEGPFEFICIVPNDQDEMTLVGGKSR